MHSLRRFYKCNSSQWIPPNFDLDSPSHATMYFPCSSEEIAHPIVGGGFPLRERHDWMMGSPAIAFSEWWLFKIFGGVGLTEITQILISGSHFFIQLLVRLKSNFEPRPLNDNPAAVQAAFTMRFTPKSRARTSHLSSRSGDVFVSVEQLPYQQTDAGSGTRGAFRAGGCVPSTAHFKDKLALAARLWWH